MTKYERLLLVICNELARLRDRGLKEDIQTWEPEKYDNQIFILKKVLADVGLKEINDAY